MARLAALMFKMAPVTNYRAEFPGAPATLAVEFFPALPLAPAVVVPKTPPVLDEKANICSPARPCCHSVLMSLSQLLLLAIAGLKLANH